MDKVLTEIFVPVLGAAYDVFLPLQSPLYEVLELLKRGVTELSDGRFRSSDETVLCNRADGTVLNINLSVYELGIQNGSKLMLI